MPNGRPIKCRITANNPVNYRRIRAQLNRHNLIRGEPRKGEMLVLISRRHFSLLRTIRGISGVDVKEIDDFPKNAPIEQGKESECREKLAVTNHSRVFSEAQKEILNRRVVPREPLPQEDGAICGIPIHEIREWALVCSKGEFLRLHGIEPREFNRAIVASRSCDPIYFTYTCSCDGCQQVFKGRDALRQFRTHVLRAGHSKARQ